MLGSRASVLLPLLLFCSVNQKILSSCALTVVLTECSLANPKGVDLVIQSFVLCFPGMTELVMSRKKCFYFATKWEDSVGWIFVEYSVTIFNVKDECKLAVPFIHFECILSYFLFKLKNEIIFR